MCAFIKDLKISRKPIPSLIIGLGCIQFYLIHASKTNSWQKVLHQMPKWPLINQCFLYTTVITAMNMSLTFLLYCCCKTNPELWPVLTSQHQQQKIVPASMRWDWLSLNFYVYLFSTYCYFYLHFLPHLDTIFYISARAIKLNLDLLPVSLSCQQKQSATHKSMR